MRHGGLAALLFWVGCGESISDFEFRVSTSGGGVIVASSTVPAFECGYACEAIVPHDEAVTFTAQAEPGQVFVGWSGACTGVAPCTARLNYASELVATFGPVYPARARAVPNDSFLGPLHVLRETGRIIVAGGQGLVGFDPAGDVALEHKIQDDPNLGPLVDVRAATASATGVTIAGSFLGDLVWGQPTLSANGRATGLVATLDRDLRPQAAKLFRASMGVDLQAMVERGVASSGHVIAGTYQGDWQSPMPGALPPTTDAQSFIGSDEGDTFAGLVWSAAASNVLSMRADPDGRVWMLVTSTTAVRLPSGTAANGTLLLVFADNDPGPGTTWEMVEGRRLGGALSPGGDLISMDDGSMVVAVSVAGDTELLATAPYVDPTTVTAVLARLGPELTPQWVRTFTRTRLLTLAKAGDAVVVGGNAEGSLDLGGDVVFRGRGGSGVGDGGSGLLAAIAPGTGQALWARRIGQAVIAAAADDTGLNVLALPSWSDTGGSYDMGPDTDAGYSGRALVWIAQ